MNGIAGGGAVDETEHDALVDRGTSDQGPSDEIFVRRAPSPKRSARATPAFGSVDRFCAGRRRPRATVAASARRRREAPATRRAAAIRREKLVDVSFERLGTVRSGVLG